MRLTNYIDCIILRHLKRAELEKRYIELLQKYEELEESTINRIDAYFYILLSFGLGLGLFIILDWIGVYFS